MIEPPRLRRRGPQVQRSQLALELALNAYALFGALVLVRLILLLLGVDDRVWIGETIYGVTDPFFWPLTRLPGGTRRLVGDVTLPDVTMVALLALVPLGLMARAGKNTR